MIEFNLSFSNIRVIEYSRRSLLRPEKRMGPTLLLQSPTYWINE